VILVAAASGCGATAPRKPLAWITSPQVYVPRDLPRDHIVVGRIRNASSDTVRVQATALRVRDARGSALESSAGFTSSYAHGLFGAFQRPSAMPIREQVRLGRIVILDPGATSPLFAAWRLLPGSREPVRIDYGSGTLPVPTATHPTAP